MNSVEFGAMQDRFSSLEARDEQHQEKLAEVSATVKELGGSVKVMKVELSANTEVTKEIKDLLVAAKTGLRVLGWMGTALKWVAGVSAAVIGAIAAWHQAFPK